MSELDKIADKKICTNPYCKQPEKLLSGFYKRKKRNGSYTLTGRCKICIEEKRRQPKKIKEILPEGFKRCSNIKCNKIKPLSRFGNSKRDGSFNRCKECRNKNNKKYYENNKENILIKSNQHYKNNREKILIKGKQYRKNNSEKELERGKKYRKNNPEKVKSSSRKWRKNNLNYYVNRRKNNINYKILHNLRGRLGKALKRNSKSASTKKLLGCSIEFLKKFLETKFYNNMSWENYGKCWEIDHIIPCSVFDFTKKEDQKKCFHYLNLQPLTCKHNNEKNNKLNWIKI